MARSIGGFFRVIGTLAILAVLGANTLMTLQLRSEVQDLESRQSPAPAGRERGGHDTSAVRDDGTHIIPTSAASPDVPALVAAAKRHADAARAALEQKDYATASHEMALSGQAAQRASRAITTEGADRLAALKGALGTVQAQTAALQARADALLGAGQGAASNRSTAPTTTGASPQADSR